MADTDEPSPPRDIQLDDILDNNNSKGATNFDFSKRDNLSDFRTPPHTLDAQKNS
jgi:hypothetical protein